MEDITGVLLAGGKSSRMGTNKALLEVGDEKVIESVIRNMTPVVTRIMIAANDKQAYAFLGKETAADKFPGLGPLSGLHTALTSALTPWCLVSACDLPFVTTEMFQLLKEAAEDTSAGPSGTAEAQAIIPVAGGRIQPLLAAYHKSALPALEESLSAGRLRLTAWLELLQVRYISEEELLRKGGEGALQAFFNMNDPKEYEQAKMKRKELETSD